jgi:hypothetical protein
MIPRQARPGSIPRRPSSVHGRAEEENIETAEEDSADFSCWICLEDGNVADTDMTDMRLASFCKCSLVAHSTVSQLIHA